MQCVRRKVHDIGKESLQIFLNCDLCLLSMCLNTTSEDHVKCSEQDFDHQTLSCTNNIQTFEEITVLLVQSYIIICLQHQHQHQQE